MKSAVTSSGSAARWGPLWGARAGDWATVEEQQAPTYEEGLRRAGLQRGQSVLDIGCGTGVFLALAAARGARVHGVDASEALAALARERVPGADVRIGEMEALPYEDDSFDVVMGFNSFFFADDMVAALREAARVAKPGAPVVLQVWGDPDRCDLEAMKGAVAPFMPAPPSDAPAPPELWRPGVLEEVAGAAGLRPESTFDLRWAYEFADDDALARALLSPGGIVRAVDVAGEDAVRAAIVDAMAPYRTPDGGYRLENEWHYLLARA